MVENRRWFSSMFFDNVDTNLKVILRKSEDKEDSENLALAEA